MLIDLAIEAGFDKQEFDDAVQSFDDCTDGSTRSMELIGPSLCDAEVFEITNVTDYFFTHHAKTMNQWQGNNGPFSCFPILAPPFENFWMESSVPKNINWGHGPFSDPGRFLYARRFGCWFLTSRSPEIVSEHLPGATWAIIANCFCNVDQDGSIYKLKQCSAHFFLNERGELLRSSIFVPEEFRTAASIDLSHDFIDLMLIYMLLPMCMALCFLNCNNVSYSTIYPSRQQLRAAVRRGKRPAVKYHTLEIRPMMDRLKYDGDVESNGLARALHICRGHFKDFRDSGLFGKHRGIYWWNQLVRGNAESGMTIKDYRFSFPVQDQERMK